MPTQLSRSPLGRLRWTEQDARTALTALQRSGEAVSVFAAEHGLDPQRLYSWRRRLGKAEPTTFQEVIVRPAARISVTDSRADLWLRYHNEGDVRTWGAFIVEVLPAALSIVAT